MITPGWGARGNKLLSIFHCLNRRERPTPGSVYWPGFWPGDAQLTSNAAAILQAAHQTGLCTTPAAVMGAGGGGARLSTSCTAGRILSVGVWVSVWVVSSTFVGIVVATLTIAKHGSSLGKLGRSFVPSSYPSVGVFVLS